MHKCENGEAEKYGDFLNYPKSHMEIWDKYYYSKYHVDFDYFPRGRVVYNFAYGRRSAADRFNDLLHI